MQRIQYKMDKTLNRPRIKTCKIIFITNPAVKFLNQTRSMGTRLAFLLRDPLTTFSVAEIG